MKEVKELPEHLQFKKVIVYPSKSAEDASGFFMSITSIGAYVPFNKPTDLREILINHLHTDKRVKNYKLL